MVIRSGRFVKNRTVCNRVRLVPKLLFENAYSGSSNFVAHSRRPRQLVRKPAGDLRVKTGH